MERITKQIKDVLDQQGKIAAVNLLNRIMAEDAMVTKKILFMEEWWNQIPLLTAILDAGVDVNVTNSAGATPLFYAASVGWRDRADGQRRVCELLIEKGADLDRRHLVRYEAPPQTWDGATALMTAARTNAVSIVDLLLSCGADPSIRDAKGCDALRHAEHQDSVGVAHLLKRHGPG